MKQQAIISIDIGTTSTKTVAFSVIGNVLFQSSIEYPILSSVPEYAEQDPDVVFHAVIDGLRTVASQLNQENYVLEGVCFSSAMHSLIAVDAHGIKLTNSIIWADTRSKAYVQNLKGSAIGHSIYLQTGTPLHAMSPLLKLCWLREHEPEIFQKTAKFIGIKEYVLYKLFGVFIVDYSVASATGLFDIFSFKWHASALDIAGITSDKLSELVPPTHMLRNLEPAFATLLNIPYTLPFIVGASDGALASLGSHAVRRGQAAITIGTSGAVRVMANEPATDKLERIFSYVLNKDHFVLGGAVNNGGVVLRWFRDTFYEAATAEAKQSKTDPYALLNRKASTISPGSNGLLFLPYLLGERAPIWDANARGCFFGVHFNHTKEHFLRAVLEGVTFGVYSVGKALEQTIGPVSSIYASGGFSRSEVWVQMLADVFNKEVLLPETPEGSAFGAAILGMFALGIIDKLEDAEKMIKVSATYSPNSDTHQRYQQNYTLFEELYPKLKESFSKINSL